MGAGPVLTAVMGDALRMLGWVLVVRLGLGLESGGEGTYAVATTVR